MVDSSLIGSRAPRNQQVHYRTIDMEACRGGSYITVVQKLCNNLRKLAGVQVKSGILLTKTEGIIYSFWWPSQSQPSLEVM